MNTWKCSVLICISTIFTLGYQIIGADQSVPDGGNAKPTVRLIEALVELGQKHDCYFTIEQIVHKTSEIDLRTISVNRDKVNKALTKTDAIKVLQEDLDNLGFTAYQSKNNPAVIHILGKNMDKLQGYWMNLDVSFEFSGMLYSGFQQLVKGVDGVEAETGFTSWDAYGLDYATNLRVSRNNTEVRRLLSDALPLSQYSRVLWYCRSRQSGQKKIVKMLFGGQVKPKTKTQTDLLHFSSGETVFRRMSKTEEGIKSAKEYIAAQLASKTPHQVRWAMLYLGKHNITQEIPLLIKHIDYKYTTCMLLEESYPAIRALALMKKASSKAALKEMTRESNDLRLQLLCHLVLLTEGTNEGSTTIRSHTSTISNNKQRARVENTLQSLLKSPHYKAIRGAKPKEES